MVKPSQPHEKLAKYNVLFLGYSAPTPNATELDALRDPLRRAYPAHATNELEGINSFLTIYTSGIQLQLVNGRSPPVFWFPIQNLYLAGANKCVNYLNPATGQVQSSQFVELGSPEAKHSSHAPLFSFISRKTKVSGLQCYTFLTKNDDSAFELVEAARYAYENKAGHSQSRIPSELAADELEPESDCSDSTSNSDTPVVINVDEELRGEKVDLFPRNLIKRQQIDRLRPRSSYDRRSQPVPPINVYPTLHNVEAHGFPIETPRYAVPPPISPKPSRVRESVKVIQPPPMYIRAPPPKTRVMVVKEPPKVIQTPPQIIRQPYPVEKEVIKEVKVPYPVRAPTPPPIYLPSEPKIIEKPVEVPVEVKVEVPVPYPVRSPTPPPQIVTQIKEVQVEVPVEVPVPYEVRAPTPPTPPPQIIEVPVQVPVYIEVEGPPQIIKEPPQIQEVPVPYHVEVPYPVEVPYEVPVEVPYHVPVEVPYQVPIEVPYRVPVEVPKFYPVPLPEMRSHRRRRSAKVREPRQFDGYYNTNHLERRHDRGYFIPPEFQAFDRRFDLPDDDRRHRGKHHRRHRARSSSSDSRSSEHRGNGLRRHYDYEISNGLSGVHISDAEDRLYRPRPDYSPRREARGIVEGYDYYRPGGRERSGRRERGSRNERHGEFYVKERRSSRRDHDRDASIYHRGMPGHLSDTISELPPPLNSHGHRNYY